jgi:hypothetical protein
MLRSYCSTCVLLLLVNGVAGCSTEGGLGQIEANAACAPTDLVCRTQGLDGPLAVGASVDIELTSVSSGSATPELTLESADARIFTVSGAQLTGVGPGAAAMLISSDGGLIMDFVHVWTRAPNRLALFRHGGDWESGEELTEPIQLVVGDELVLSAELYRDAEGLLGRAETTFSSSGEALQLLQIGYPGHRRLLASEPGTATVTVEALGLSAELAVEVLP